MWLDDKEMEDGSVRSSRWHDEGWRESVQNTHMSPRSVGKGRDGSREGGSLLQKSSQWQGP